MGSAIGAGGMGEVYRARDTKLNRDVALKVLPVAFVLDADRVARFRREAQVLASLNHPNIATIHGFEESAGVQALVMELVDGDTLDQRIRRARSGSGWPGGGGSAAGLPLNDALRIARQIADALDAAHQKGIIHRDLKPANIKVTADGLVKVLDFGLAKLSPVEEVEPLASSPPTGTDHGTREGVVVGTAAYMSPEQARGQAVDKRTDIWAFGCVLYEMLSGRTAFARPTTTDTLVAVVEREPDWAALPGETPAVVRRLLGRCLEKDPQHRMRDIGDVRIGLEDLVAAPDAIGAQRGRDVRIPRWIAFGIVGICLGAAALTWYVTRQRNTGPASESSRVLRFEMMFDRASLDPGAIPKPSPDGRRFVLSGVAGQERRMLWIHSLDSGEARALPGTEGGIGAIWSPDGRWIAFHADGRLKKVNPDGGTPQTIASIPGFQDATWGSRGDIIFRPSNREPLFRIRESGGSPAPLTQLDRGRTENSHRGPFFLPDGQRFLYTNRCEQRQHNGLFIGSLDSSTVRQVMPLQSNAAFFAPREGTVGWLLYFQDGGVVARRFETETLTFAGNPIPVIDRVAYNAAGVRAAFETSVDGSVILWSPPGDNARLTWFNRKGEATGTTGPPGDYLQPRLSPTSDRIAFIRADIETGNRDIWYTEVARGIAARVTVDGANDWYPLWSPDAKHMIFTSDRGGSLPIGAGGSLFVKRSMDPGRDESLLLPARISDTGAYDWSRDGKWVSFGGQDLWIVSPIGEPNPFPFLATSFSEGAGRFSPDARWIAYSSNETGRFEVYVRRFDGGPASAEGKVQISNGGGEHPVWRSDGQELFYMSGNANDVMVHAVSTRDLNRSGAIPVAVPVDVPLFRACPDTSVQFPLAGAPYNYLYDTVDGERFVVTCRTRRPGRFGVLLNWVPESREQ